MSTDVTLVADTANRLFADAVTPEVVNAVEAGIHPAALWQLVEQAGFTAALEPDSGVSLPEALAVLRAAGSHAVPIPLAETMLARFIGAVDPDRFSWTVLSLLAPGPVRAQLDGANCKVTSIGMSRRPKPVDLLRLIQVVSSSTPDIVHGWMYHGNVAATLGSAAISALAYSVSTTCTAARSMCWRSRPISST